MIELITLNYRLEESNDWSSFASFIAESIKRALKTRRLYKPSLLYRGFPYRFLKRVMDYGTQENKNATQIYAGSEHMEWYDLENIIQYAWKEKSSGLFSKIFKTSGNFAIAIYDPQFFNDITSKGLCTLNVGVTFKEAIIAVIVFIPNK